MRYDICRWGVVLQKTGTTRGRDESRTPIQMHSRMRVGDDLRSSRGSDNMFLTTNPFLNQTQIFLDDVLNSWELACAEVCHRPTTGGMMSQPELPRHQMTSQTSWTRRRELLCAPVRLCPTGPIDKALTAAGYVCCGFRCRLRRPLYAAYVE